MAAVPDFVVMPQVGGRLGGHRQLNQPKRPGKDWKSRPSKDWKSRIKKTSRQKTGKLEPKGLRSCLLLIVFVVALIDRVCC